MHHGVERGELHLRRKLLIADEHELMLAGIRKALAGAPDLEIVGQTTSGSDVVPLVECTGPDVVLLGLRLPESDGLRVLEELHARFPDVKAVVLSGSDEPELVEAAFRRGAAGFVLKRVDRADLAPVLRTILDGFVYHPLGGTDHSEASELGLTRREDEILRAVGAGRSNKQIARELWVTEQTVKFHLTKVYRKLGVASRAEAVHEAYARGVLENPLLQAIA